MKMIFFQLPAAMTVCPARGVVGMVPPSSSAPALPNRPGDVTSRPAHSPVREVAPGSPPMGSRSHLEQVKRRRLASDYDDDSSPRDRRRHRRVDVDFSHDAMSPGSRAVDDDRVRLPERRHPPEFLRCAVFFDVAG